MSFDQRRAQRIITGRGSSPNLRSWIYRGETYSDWFLNTVFVGRLMILTLLSKPAHRSRSIRSAAARASTLYRTNGKFQRDFICPQILSSAIWELLFYVMLPKQWIEFKRKSLSVDQTQVTYRPEANLMTRSQKQFTWITINLKNRWSVWQKPTKPNNSSRC